MPAAWRRSRSKTEISRYSFRSSSHNLASVSATLFFISP